ncbi:MAG: NAD-dependent epimerase/dehydratase family protein [Lautropia sp.]
MPASATSASATAAASGRTFVVTGAAGFIGMHAARRLLSSGHQVIGIDDLNPYYPPILKEARLRQLTGGPHAGRFAFHRADIADPAAIDAIFAAAGGPVDTVLHLAAQAGVRYSMQQPLAYSRSNLVGTTVLLEACRHHRAPHLVYASSSSVYGDRADPPFRETDTVDTPSSFYAATKRANELMVQSYCHLYGLRATGLRLFTVYGPWGRPDMAPWLFTEKIIAGTPIRVFGDGLPRRDFTFVDDAVDNIVRLIDRPAAGSASPIDHRIVNIGSDSPVTVNGLIETVEALAGRAAIRRFEPLPPGDVPMTAADPALLEQLGGARPWTPLADGMARFVDWYRSEPEIAAAMLASRTA